MTLNPATTIGHGLILEPLSYEFWVDILEFTRKCIEDHYKVDMMQLMLRWSQAMGVGIVCYRSMHVAPKDSILSYSPSSSGLCDASGITHVKDFFSARTLPSGTHL